MTSPKKYPLRKKSAAPASPPTPSAMDSVYTLWDEVNTFPAGRTDEALTHLALGIQRLLRADNVRWLAAVRVSHGVKAKQDPLLGWRLRDRYELIPDSPEYLKLIAWWFQRNNQIEPTFHIGLATFALAAGHGKFRVHRMRDGWIPFADFRRSEHYRLHYTELGITDRMWISLPLNADTESILLIDRIGPSPRFTKREADLAGTISRGIRPFHRRLFLSRGLHIGETPLSPVSRRILQKLLTGMSEKQIALSLNQSVSTTHTYVKSIYHRFGVNGRAALMSLWLGA